MTSVKHSIIGLPRSGKTTFLAALWHLLNASEVDSKFVLDKLVGDTTHLNTIVEYWRKCEVVPRTSMAAEAKVSIHVREASTGKEAVLHFPDLSGETFESHLATRLCASDYVEDIDSSCGILLFVTADRESDGISILDLAPLVDGEEVKEKPEEHKEWTPKLVSIQVNLVQLLQFLQRTPFQPKVRRVAVVVSAWDVIDSKGLEPSQWLQRELPLLHQFFVSNPKSFVFNVYGVSAQGGDVKGASKGELVLKTPSTRICCVGPDTDPHDLTSPIAWLMSGE